MKDSLTDSEIQFLASQNLGPEDVFDARSWSQHIWFRLIKEQGKTVALGSKCRKAGHRLRSRKGHCVQCDTSKLAFVARYDLEQYVYILGSRTARLLKIGTCKDMQQRLNQICFERHGSAGDWTVLYSLYLPRSGEIENRTLKRLSAYAVYESYWKNGQVQTSIEMLRCPFTLAMKTLNDIAGDTASYSPWKMRDTSAYEFEPD